MDDLEGKWGTFKKKELIFINIYYILLLIIGICIVLIVFNDCQPIESEINFISMFKYGLGFELMMNSTYYIRKVYKECIAGTIIINNHHSFVKKLGIIIYLITRPIFGIAFFQISLIIFYNFCISLVKNIGHLNQSVIYWSIIFAIFMGYSTGKVLDLLEQKSTEFINKLGGGE